MAEVPESINSMQHLELINHINLMKILIIELNKISLFSIFVV